MIDMRTKVRDPNYAARYEQRVLDHKCTRCGKPAVPDTSLCVKHLASERERWRRAKQRKRRELRRRKLCIDGCGRKVEHVGSVRCAICQPRSVPQGVTQVTTTIVPMVPQGVTQGSPKRAGRASRGRPSQAHIDGQDIDFAIDALSKAKAALHAVGAPEVQALPKYRRDEMKRSALAHIDHGARFLDDILERNNYVAGMELRDRAAK